MPKPIKTKQIFQTHKGPRWGQIAIVPKEWQQQSKQRFNHFDDIVGLDINKDSILAYMLSMPRDLDIHLLQPPNINRNEWAYFEELVNGGIRVRNSVLFHLQKFDALWLENSYRNYERIKNSRPLPTQDSNDKTAFIFGNGPSITTFLDSQLNWGMMKGKFFCCWHAVPKMLAKGLEPDFVVHIDAVPPVGEDWQPPELAEDIPLITCPTVAPEFLDAYPNNPVFTMFSHDRWMHGPMAKALGMPDAPHTVGTVTHAQSMASIILGHRKVVLIGVDLADTNPDSYIFDDAFDPSVKRHGIKKLVNKHGIEVWTEPAFESCVAGFEDLAERFEGVKFYNASKVGLDLRGFEVY